MSGVSRQRRKKPGRKRVLRALIGLAVAILVVGGGLWMVVHHVPGWYKPVYVPEAQIDQVRTDAVRNYSRFGDGLVRHNTFAFTLDERQVSEWITAREHIWPESGDWLPAWVKEPVVSFRDGHILVGARLDFDGHQLIAGAYLTIELGSDDILVVRLDRVVAGSLPLPLSALGGPLAQLLRLEGRDLDFLPESVADTAEYFRESEPVSVLSKGIRRANRFIWENGRRPYRIDAIKIADGKLTLTIEPL